MRVLFTYLIIFSAYNFSYSQSNKTLKDSIFEVGDVIKIPQVLYCLDGNGKENDSTFKTISTFINSYKNFVFEISSYTDSRGNPKLAQDLTSRRVVNIKKVLVKEYFVDTNQLTLKAFGSSKLLIKNDSIQKAKTKQEKEELHAKNRRTELRIVQIK